MGHKNIKDHYGIKHTVAVYSRREYGGDCIGIGSHYDPEIIVIRICDAKVIKQYKNGKYDDGWSTNEDLARYDEAIKADEKNGVLKKLIETPDTFEEFLPVFTAENGVVIREFCEEYGYPNTTHSGNRMYDNTYFKTRKEAYSYLLKDTSADVRYCGFKRGIQEAFRRIGRAFNRSFMSLYYWVKARTVGLFYTKTIQK